MNHPMVKKNIKTIIIILIVSIIIVAGYYSYQFYLNEKKASTITEYKKGFYDGVLCEYNCPLSLQTVNNKTSMLPKMECIKACGYLFRKNFASLNFTKSEINKDNLITDMDNLKKDCIKNNTNMTALKLDNVGYFKCNYEELIKLKTNYTYLK